MAEILGIPFEDFENPIAEALHIHSERTDGRVMFNVLDATNLEPAAEGKAYSARSESGVFFDGDYYGKLVTVVFAPGDGTGDESAYRLSRINTDLYPQAQAVVPREKTGAAEVGLSLLSVDLAKPTQPGLLAGNLDLITLQGGAATWLGYIGQHRRAYQRIMGGTEDAEPTTTLTHGSYLQGDRLSDEAAFRFGNPHALYNDHPRHVQVASFIGIPSSSPRDRALVRSLLPTPPKM